MNKNANEISLEEVDGIEDPNKSSMSMATLPSLEFPRRIDVQSDDNEEEESDSEELGGERNSDQNASNQSPSPEGSIFGEISTTGSQVLNGGSAETLADPYGIPFRSNTSMLAGNTEHPKLSRLEGALSRKQTIENLPLPTFEVKLERLRGIEKFDAFSEDEEPVLRKDYQPVEHKPNRAEPNIGAGNIIVYNVRKGEAPQNEKHTQWDRSSGVDQRSPSSLHRAFIVSLNHRNERPSSNSHVFPSPSNRQTSIRKSRSRTEKGRCGSLNEDFWDTTPHQRDLFFVSFEELSSKEVAVIKGLWKCITFDLWTFGAITTINLFKLRGHINGKDSKAAPDVMMECRFLWPHANHTMKALESVVMNLSRPSVSHKLIYETGRKHWKLKTPVTEEQKQLCINAFMYTFADHVHPRPNLNEMRTMRKFCNITMYLFADASRWDSEPSTPF